MAKNSPHQSLALMVGKRDSKRVCSSTWKATVCGEWRRHSPCSPEVGLKWAQDEQALIEEEVETICCGLMWRMG